MHTSNALSRLHNFTDTPDQKDVIPLNFLQHFTPHYIEHSYCKAQPRRALLGYPFHNTAAQMEATSTREGI